MSQLKISSNAHTKPPRHTSTAETFSSTNAEGIEVDTSQVPTQGVPAGMNEVEGTLGWPGEPHTEASRFLTASEQSRNSRYGIGTTITHEPQPDAISVTSAAENRTNRKYSTNPASTAPVDRYPPLKPELFDDFEKKYHPDAFGDEASPNARVWRVYRDRVTDLDDDLLDGWHKTLDVLLIFMGLFSAVATAFIVETSKRLQPDFTEITAKAVIALLSQSNNASSVTPALPSLESGDPDTRARWISGIWFVSLTLALLDALLVILTKQWLVDYTSKQRQPAACAQQWAWRHYAFRQGLDRWGISVFISILFVILYAALYFFLTGLLVFLFQLDTRICIIPTAITAIVSIFHLATTIAPLWWGDCPTTTPLLSHLALLFSLTRWLIFWICHVVALPLYLLGRFWDYIRKQTRHGPQFRPNVSWFRAVRKIPPYDGAAIIKGQEPLRNAFVISWMIQNLLTDADVGVAVDAVGACDRAQYESFSWQGENPLQIEAIGRTIEQRLINLYQSKDQRDRNLLFRQQAAVLRSLLFIRRPMPWSMLAFVRPLLEIEIYDIEFFAEMLWNRNTRQPEHQHAHLNIFGKLGERYANADPIGMQRINNLTMRLLWMDTMRIGDMAAQDEDIPEDAMFVFYGMIKSAIQEPVSPAHLHVALRTANDWLERRIESHCDSTVRERWSAVLTWVNPHPLLETLVKWAWWITDKDAPGQLGLNRELCFRFYQCILAHAASTSNEVSWPIKLVEVALGCFVHSNDAYTRWKWEPQLLRAALRVLRKTKIMQQPSRNWSGGLDKILHGVLLKASALENARMAVSEALGLLLLELTTGPDAHTVAHSFANSHAERADILAHSVVNILIRRPTGTAAHTSSWELSMKIAEPFDPTFTETAQLLAIVLFFVSRMTTTNNDLEELVDALAGGERGLELAVANRDAFDDSTSLVVPSAIQPAQPFA
ncbi:hypothetical protein BKA62DRAFT_758936 [Auriculariales sp. MPI-PUGE-AT-0066]|nr:hypothetical protein BKA62DRAFT_758936 [Auriculariales sp. MPI-PUGE-AT-0066]